MRDEQVGPRFRRPALWMMLVLPLVAACSLVFTQPSIRVAGVRVAEFGITSGTAEVLVQVDNPNRYGLEVRGLDYRLQIEDSGAPDGWRDLSTGVWPDTVQLPSRDTIQLAVRIPFSYSALGAALSGLMSNGSVGYQVDGSTRVDGPTGEVHVPFRHRGRLKP